MFIFIVKKIYFIINFEQTSHLALVFLVMNLNK